MKREQASCHEHDFGAARQESGARAQLPAVSDLVKGDPEPSVRPRVPVRSEATRLVEGACGRVRSENPKAELHEATRSSQVDDTFNERAAEA